MTRLFVTGANGYIGRRLVEIARRAGLEVVEGVRDRRGGADDVRFDLRHPDDLAEVLRDVDVVIHLAAILDRDLPPGDQDPNVVGTRWLLEAARHHNVCRFIFVSSQSAAADAASGYGQQKWRIEQLLAGDGEVALRLGLVSGGPPRGVYGQLFRMLKRWPAMPVLCSGAPIHPLHLDDLCQALVTLVEGGKTLPRIFWIGPREPLRFADYLRLVARERVGRRVRMMPVPVTVVLAVFRLASFVPFLPKFPDERIRGLAALRPMDPRQYLASSDVRPIAEVFSAEGRRRRLIVEGKVLTAYVLGRRPVPSTVRRYVRAVLESNDSEPLDLPGLARVWPGLLRVWEPLAAAERPLRRLELATRVVEMTPEAAPRFHLYEPSPRLFVVFELVWVITTEALLLPLRVVLGRLGSLRQ